MGDHSDLRQAVSHIVVERDSRRQEEKEACQEAAAKECHPDAAESPGQLECSECPPCASESKTLELTLSCWQVR